MNLSSELEQVGIKIMIGKIIAVSLVCFLSFGFQATKCGTKQDDRMIEMSPDVSAGLVFFFKKGTTWQEILEFQRTVTGVPAPNGTGFSDLPGIMSGVKIELNGFEGEAINFQPDATEEQKAFVKKRVTESPLIFKVYENVIPARITDLPDSPKTLGVPEDNPKAERKVFRPASTPSP